MDDLKKCTKCGQEKPATNEYFSKQKGGKNGLSSSCKQCYKLYAQQNAESIRERKKKYRQENHEHIKEVSRIYREQNKEFIKKYRQENADYLKEYLKEYCKSNKDKCKTRRNRYRSLKRQLPSTLTAVQWHKIKETFNNRCAYCNKQTNLAQEHFIPLSKGGEYTHNNIIPACKSCNSSKGNKDFFEWYPQYKYYSKKREKKILKLLNYEENGVQQLQLI